MVTKDGNGEKKSFFTRSIFVKRTKREWKIRWGIQKYCLSHAARRFYVGIHLIPSILCAIPLRSPILHIFSNIAYAIWASEKAFSYVYTVTQWWIFFFYSSLLLCFASQSVLCVAWYYCFFFSPFFSFSRSPKSKIVVAASYLILFCIVSYRKSTKNIACKGEKVVYILSTVCVCYFIFITSYCASYFYIYIYISSFLYAFDCFRLILIRFPVVGSLFDYSERHKTVVGHPFASHFIKMLWTFFFCSSILKDFSLYGAPKIFADNAFGFPSFSINFHAFHLSQIPSKHKNVD